MSEDKDIVLNRKTGYSEVTAGTEDGKAFLDEQYGGNIKIEDINLTFFLEYIKKIGLSSKLFL